MNNVRGDIAAAATRMQVVFGTRSAMKHLVHSLEAGEHVREMVACLFAGANGLLVLTDRRVLALRDDYSRYSMKSAALEDITLIDYGPTVHDGFAAFTDAGRVAVRKMNRADSDRFVEVLTASLPAVPVVTSHPSARAGTNARPAKTGPAGRQPGTLLIDEPVCAADEPAARPAVTVSGPGGADTRFISGADALLASPTARSDDSQAPPVPVPTPRPIAVPTIPQAPQPCAPTDKEVLYGVLADLHARGLLTAEELAVKVAAVAAKP